MGRTSRWMAVPLLLASVACAPEGILAPEAAPVSDRIPAPPAEPARAEIEAKPAAERASAPYVIRCGSSLRISDSREPLYVVDGAVLGEAPDLQALDIHEIQVLEGATAASLFGSRAAYGVVIVTTRAAHARRRA